SALREPQDTFRDDVAEDLRGPALDRVSARTKLLALPVPVLDGMLPTGEHRVWSLDLERQLREPLVPLRPHELRRRTLRARHPRLQELRERPVVREPKGLQLRPQPADVVAD